MSKTLRCIVCKSTLTDMYKYQPDGGTAFHSQGHFGSSVTDHMDGTVTSVCVCDECMKIALKSGVAIETKGYPHE